MKVVVVQALALPPQDILQNLYGQWSKQDRQIFENNFKKRSQDVVSNLKAHRLWNDMTKEEQDFLQSIPPKVKFQSHLNAMWRLESAVVLMWALGLTQEFPLFDAQTNPELLKEIPHADINRFIADARLLPEGEIEKRRSLAELWHWRSRTRQLVEEKKALPPELGFESYDQIVSMVANEAHKEGDLTQIVNNDFAAKGKAYRDLSAEEWSEVRSITIERHFALNWISGYAKGNKWDKTPTDT